MGLVGAGNFADLDRAWTAAVGVEILTLFIFSISTEVGFFFLKRYVQNIRYVYIFIYIYMDVCKNMGTSKWMVKIMENPIKMDDLGVPLLLEISIYIYTLYIYIMEYVMSYVIFIIYWV